MPCSSINLNAILLDLDGTLLDTEKHYKAGWKMAAKQLGFTLKDSDYIQFVGRPFSQCITMMEQFLPAGINIDTFLKQLQNSQQLNKGQNISTKQGVKSLFAFIKKHDFPTALVTSSTYVSVETFLENTNSADIFNEIVTFESTNEHKPLPAPYHYACQLLNVSPAHTIAIEDSNHGAQAAIEAGCNTIIIPDLLPIKPAIARRATGIYTDLTQVTKKVLSKLVPLQ